MRSFRPFFVFGVVLSVFALGAQIQSKRAAAQLLGGPIVGGKLPDLPAPPGLSNPKTLPKMAPTTAPRPVATPGIATPAIATPAPVWKSRFWGQRVIRVGLSTAGSDIRAYFPGGATLWSNQLYVAKIEAGETAVLSLQPDKTVAIQWSSQQKTGLQNAYFSVNGDPSRISSNGNSARYGRPYRGDLEIFPQKLAEPFHRTGPLAIVNVVPIEAYLKGVVPWEMGPSAPPEALKAQAICARTKTLDFVQSKRFVAGNFDICDYDACQGYPGTENEKPATSAAVEATKGLAIYQNGRPIDAVYSTNSGGITANARDVWKGTTPITYLQSVPDFPANSPLAKLWEGGMTESEWAQFCANDFPSYARPDGISSSRYEARKYRWNQFVSVEEVQKVFGPQGFQRVTDIVVVERSGSGRIKKLGVAGIRPLSPLRSGMDAISDLRSEDIGKSLLIEGDGKIRAMFSGRLGSTTALPSSLFTISPQTDASGAVIGWNLQGAGWGHGVGMCQRGAQNHAREGWDARKILNWYYRGVEIH